MHVAGGHCDVDHPPGQQRPHDLDPALDAEKRECAVHQGAVRAGVDEQATHQLAVVRLAEDVVFVRLSCGSSHSAVS